MLTLVNTSVGLIEGDSTLDFAFPYQFLNRFVDWVDSYYQRHRSTMVFTRPVWIKKATSGATTTIVEARLSAELAANPCITFANMGLGVNDVHTGVDIPTVVVPKVTSIMAKFAAAGVAGNWFGPLCWGEDGAFSAGIAAYDAAVKPIVEAVPGWKYVSQLSTVFQVLEPVLNPTNLANGPLTCPDGTAHPNPFGASQMCQLAAIPNTQLT